MTLDEWNAEGERRFGTDRLNWKFKCPACKHVASVRDYKEAMAPEGAVGFSCIGRWTGALREAFEGKRERPGPCNYAGGGLIGLNPVEIVVGDKSHRMFEFA